MSLLQPHLKSTDTTSSSDPHYNMILLNNLVHTERPPPPPSSSSSSAHHRHHHHHHPQHQHQHQSSSIAATSPPPPPPLQHNRVPRRPGRHPNGIDAPIIDPPNMDPPSFDFVTGGGMGSGMGGGGGYCGGGLGSVASENSTALLSELLTHVRQINEEMHSRASGQDTDDHYKSEWRMVALVLDRILLIIFFIMTLFTCVTIFVNVPH